MIAGDAGEEPRKALRRDNRGLGNSDRPRLARPKTMGSRGSTRRRASADLSPSVTLPEGRRRDPWNWQKLWVNGAMDIGRVWVPLPSIPERRGSPQPCRLSTITVRKTGRLRLEPRRSGDYLEDGQALAVAACARVRRETPHAPSSCRTAQIPLSPAPRASYCAGIG
jgi:hypothetical protein